MKLAFLLLFLGILFQTQAQIRLGGTVGYNLYQSISRETGLNSSITKPQQRNNILGKSDYTPSLSSGFHAGMLIDLSIKKPVYLQIGLLYELISGKSKHYYNVYYPGGNILSSSNEYSERIHLTYFTVPILFNIVKADKKGKLSISVGPQFSLGLGGWYRADLREFSATYYHGTTYYSSTVEYKEAKGIYHVQSDKEGKLEGYSDDPGRHYRQLYVALHLGLGYELNKTLFRVYYAQGLTNTEANHQHTLYNYATNYSGINFSVTYFFARYSIIGVLREAL